MPTFTHTTRLPHPPEVVFGWHERSGAFLRLSPPLLSTVVAEPSEGLRDGSLSRLRVALPGLPRLPGPLGRAGWPWLARHQGYQPPHVFEDVMVSGPFARWRHRHVFESDGQQATRLTDEVTYELPGPARRISLPDRLLHAQLRRMFAYRSRQLAADLAFHAAHPTPRTIAVSGATGLVGRQLVALLGGGGHRVLRLVRHDTRSPEQIAWDPATGQLDTGALREVDAVIHLAGEPIGKRFTPAHKQRVLTSRTESTALLAQALADLAADGKPRALIVASGAGYYGADRGDEVLDENSSPGNDFLAEVCQAWEAAADPARDAGVRVAHVRTGLVQSAAGGQLGLQLPLFQAGLGGRLGQGTQWLPWIMLDDLIRLYAHVALTDGLTGPVNASAPHPVRAADYAKTLASVLHRPALLPVPSLGPQLLLGTEGAKELALAGQRMSADRAHDWGFSFTHPTLREGLEHELVRAQAVVLPDS